MYPRKRKLPRLLKKNYVATNNELHLKKKFALKGSFFLTL